MCMWDWRPTSFPRSCPRIVQKYLQKIFCWESKPIPLTFGIAPIKMYCRGIVYTGDEKVEMRLLAKNLTRLGEYKLENHPPGYPTTTRTNWKFAEVDVKDAEPANCQGLANSRTLHSTLQSESANVLAAPTSALTLAFADSNSKPGPKRPREGDCRIKAMWSKDDLAKGPATSFWVGSTVKCKQNAWHMECPKVVPWNICWTDYVVTAKKPIQSQHVKLDSAPSATSSQQYSYLYQFLQSIYVNN